MKMLFKQRFFSWFDSYDIYDEAGNTLYIVKGQLSWGHCLKIFSPEGAELGTVKERVFTFLPKFELYMGSSYIGCIKKEFTFFKPSFNIDFNGWHIDGGFMEWDYTVYGCGRLGCSHRFKGNFQLDRYIRYRRCKPERRALRLNACACN